MPSTFPQEGGRFLYASIPLGLLLILIALVVTLWWQKKCHASERCFSISLLTTAVDGLLVSGPNKLRKSVSDDFGRSTNVRARRAAPIGEWGSSVGGMDQNC